MADWSKTMYETPSRRAKILLELHYGDKESALTEIYNMARVFSNTPTTWFRDVAKEIESM